MSVTFSLATKLLIIDRQVLGTGKWTSTSHLPSINFHSLFLHVCMLLLYICLLSLFILLILFSNIHASPPVAPIKPAATDWSSWCTLLSPSPLSPPSFPPNNPPFHPLPLGYYQYFKSWKHYNRDKIKPFWSRAVAVMFWGQLMFFPTSCLF